MDPWVWTLICLALAFLFAFLEIFVTSGGILAFLSAVALIGSVVFAFLDNPVFGGSYMAGVIVGVPVLLWFAFKWWPHSPMGRRILLNPDDDPALAPNPELDALKKMIGKRGVAKSKMMLSGLIEVEGKRLNAISESETVEPGEEVVVVRVDGIGVLVRKAPMPIVAATETVDAVEDPFV